MTKAIAIPLIIKRIAIFLWARQEEGRYPPGGVSTPGHGQGEGPVGYKFPPSGGDAGDNGRGRSGAKRNGVLREGISLPPWFGTAEGSLPGLFVPCRVLKHGSGNDMRPKRSHRRAGAKHEKEDDLKSFGLFGHPQN